MSHLLHDNDAILPVASSISTAGHGGMELGQLTFFFALMVREALVSHIQVRVKDRDDRFLIETGHDAEGLACQGETKAVMYGELPIIDSTKDDSCLSRVPTLEPCETPSTCNFTSRQHFLRRAFFPSSFFPLSPKRHAPGIYSMPCLRETRGRLPSLSLSPLAN
jgi:hypothetical protein